MFSFAVRMPLQITTFSSRGKENNDSDTIREVIIAQIEPTIISDGGENDLRPSSSPHSLPPHTSPAAIVLNYVWRNWLEVSSQPLLYDRSPSVSCISDDDGGPILCPFHVSIVLISITSVLPTMQPISITLALLFIGT